MMRPPGTGALGSIAVARHLLRDPRVVVMEYTRRYGPVWSSMMPSAGGRLRKLVWLMGQAGNERVLAPQFKDDFSWYEGYRFTMEAIFGRDVLILKDDTPERPAHRERHRTLVPAFHPRMDAAYIPLMRDIALREFAGYTEGQVVDMAEVSRRLTFHIVARLMLGADEEDLADLDHRFEELGLGLFSVFRVALPGFRFHRGLRARRHLAAYIGERIRRYRESGNIPDNMLGSLMRKEIVEGEPLPDETLVSEMIAFLFAGYDTTSSLLTSFIIALSRREDIYAAIRDEARALPELSYAAMGRQEVLEATMAEVERLDPPLVFSMRGVLRPFSFGGFDLLPGDQVAYSSYYSGRMPELFERPEAFLPERFMGAARVPPYAIVAFGGGHRACIGKRFAGLEVRLLVNLLLQMWDLEFIPGQPEEVFFNPALQRKGGYRVRIRKRPS